MMTTDDNNSSHSPPPVTPDTPAPTPADETPVRAFAQGTGVLLQTVGLVMLLLTGCLWTTGGELDSLADQPVDVQLAQQPEHRGVMLTIVGGTVAGFALAVFGFGLQTDQSYAGYAAAGVNVLLIICLAVAGIMMWGSDASSLFRVSNGILLVTGVALLPFTIAALREIRKHPPPKGMEVLPGDYKIPYSHLHDDSPQVRMEKELIERRKQLEAQQRDIERLERILKDHDKE